jgi:hypothetical protein
MIKGINAGIIAAIKAEFGAEYRVYDELPEQGLKEPCFYVKLVTPTTTRAVGRRAKKSYVFNITYFPKSTINPNAECMEVSERLSVALQDIIADGKVVHADAEITSQFVDGNLQVKAGYTIPAMLGEDKVDNMEILEQTVTAE